MKIKLLKKETYKRLTMLLTVLLFLTLAKAAQAHPAPWVNCPDPTESARVLMGPESNAIYIEICVDDYSIVRPPGEYLYQREGDVLIYIKNFNLSDSPGNPALPYRVLNVALPPDADRSSLKLEVIHFEEEKLTRPIGITPAPPLLFDQMVRENEQHISEIEEWGFGKSIVEGRNTLVYNEDQLYPGEYAKLVSSGQLRKWNVASISLYPIRFNPVQREAFLAKHIIAKLVFNMQPRILGQPIAQKLLKDNTLDDQAKEILLNYNQAKEWYNQPLYRIPKIAREVKPVPDVLPPKKADYVIITTTETYENSEALLNFCGHKEKLGYSVMVVTEHNFYTVTELNGDFFFISGEGGGYEDVDEGGLRPQKIRKWLSEHYVDLGIKYVLLIGNPHPGVSDSGDNGISIPMQFSHCAPHYSRSDDYIPTDLYYADLLGNWDLDGDDKFGEWAWHNAANMLPIGIDKDHFAVRWEGYLEVDDGVPEGINRDCFSVRWEGYLEVVDRNDSGDPVDVGFVVFADGQVKVELDGDIILDVQEEYESPGEWCSDLKCIGGPLVEGRYPLKIEYRQSSGDVHFRLQVSNANLKHEEVLGSGNYKEGLKAYYFNNDTLADSPTVERIDKSLTIISPVDVGFELITDGQVEIKLGDEVIFDEPDVHEPPIRRCGGILSPICISPLIGGRYPLKIDYKQSSGDAHMMFTFSRMKPKYKTESGSFGNGLKAKYCNNHNFDEAPVVERVENRFNLSLTGDRGPGGVDFFPEIIVGRIPFYSADDGTAEVNNLDKILRKIIVYENQGPDEAHWRFNVLSSTPKMYPNNNPKVADYNGCETLKTEVAPEPLWNWYRIHDEDYEVGAEVTDGCSVQKTIEAWKEGRGVVMWRTHGSQTGASRVFKNFYCGELDDGMPSIVLMMSCGNGWPEYKSLGYSLLEHGAIATISATRVTRGGIFDPKYKDTFTSKRNSYLLYYLGKAVFENVKVGEALAHFRSAETGNAAPGFYHWWVVWNNVLAYNLYGDPSLSLFGKDVKSNNDIVLLLDGSGSMLREGKWEAAKDASVLLYDLLKALRHPTFRDRYNGIVFRCQGGADASTALFPDGLQNLSDTPLTIDSLDQFTPEPNFFTPMGSGLEAAVRNMDIQSPMSFYSNKVIVLLSDGKHNCGTNPLDVPIPEGVKVYTIGLGEDHIEPETIEKIATSTGAAYKITPSPCEMEELFIQIATETSWKLQDVPVVNSKASVSQDKVAFVLVWDNPEDSLSFELDLPGDGPNLTPDNLDSFSPMKCIYNPPASHTTHAFYVCEGIPQELLGEWQFTNIRNGSESVDPGDVLLKVIEDPIVIATFDIEKIDHYIGQPMVLSARLTEDGKPLTGMQQVYADLVRSPAFPLGTLLSENSPSADHPSAPPPNSDRTPRSHYIEGIMKELKIDSLSKPGGFRVELRDDGLGIDRRAGDGIYTGVFTRTEYEGSYTFKFRSRGKNMDGVTFDRTQTLSKYVKFAANPDSTSVEVVSVKSSQESEYLYATIRVTPRDVFGAHMGPFRGDRIRVWSNSGRFDGGYVDRKDGSYDFTLSYKKENEPQISVSTDDVIVADRIQVLSKVPSPRSFSLHAGLSIPTGTLNTNYNRDYSLGLNLDYHFTQQFSVVWLVLGYHHFNASTSSLRGTYWCNISSNLKYEFNSRRLRPYVNGGPGIYIPGSGSTRFGFNVGLGLDYWLASDWTIELGGDYHHIFTSGSDTAFKLLHVGLIYRF